MGRLVIVLDKYSDWLEAYSAVKDFSFTKLEVCYLENERNDSRSVESLFKDFVPGEVALSFTSYLTGEELFKGLELVVREMRQNDCLVAPFIRYRDFWKLAGLKGGKYQTIHISECLPDTFGQIGYRLGFRGRSIKAWLTLPLAKIYALSHMPDICYFPLAQWMKNPFVRQTRPIIIPPLPIGKRKVLDKLLGNERRPLIIGGFGYDAEKIAKVSGYDKYIATSKGIEIIVDGRVIPLDERICAEEVLIYGAVSEIAGYASSAVIWAKLLYPNMPIQCYSSTALDKKYSPFYTIFAKKSLNKMGIIMQAEDGRMLA